jgi:dienelactone hydrolase
MSGRPEAEKQRARLWARLGTQPPATPRGERLARETRDGYVLERWRLAYEDGPAPALLTLPPSTEIRGVVLYHHAHGGRFDIGKDELVHGRPSLLRPYAADLAARGWAALAIDHRGFGERAVDSERMLVKRELWQGRTLWGLRVRDAVGAASFVKAHAELASPPLVALGLSMGSTLAWWSAALDPRVDAVAELCCLAEFDALVASGAYDLHGEYFFVPGLLAEFSAASINTLIVPRPHLSIVGRDDPLTPPAGVASIDAALRAAYADAGASHAWLQRVYPVGHRETPEMRDEVLGFLDERTHAASR